MRHLITLGALTGALALTAVAQAGGWATVGFSPLPDGTDAGATWTPEITVRQHGVTPLGGLSPLVTVENVASGERDSFTATETATTGVYRADVVFPSGGDWRVVVESGFWGEGGTVTYGPFTVDGSPPAAGPGSFPTAPVALGGLVALFALGGLAVLGIRRTRRLTPAGH